MLLVKLFLAAAREFFSQPRSSLAEPDGLRYKCGCYALKCFSGASKLVFGGRFFYSVLPYSSCPCRDSLMSCDSSVSWRDAGLRSHRELARAPQAKSPGSKAVFEDMGEA